MKQILRLGEGYGLSRVKRYIGYVLLIYIGVAWLPDNQAHAQTKARTLSGTVLDAETGKPLEGATIKTTSPGGKLPRTADALTDAAGKFSLYTNLPGGIISITYIGFQTQTVNFGPDTKLPLTIKLEAEGNELEEVPVSTGYQHINPERFVGSAAILDSSNYARRTGVNILERLDGTVPGVLFDKKTIPGIGPPVQIRGISTLGGNMTTSENFLPLVVIDDFPVPMDRNFNLNDVNQNDILSVTVLKDAAAASVWGTRAGNGVIVITTKKGHYNQKTNISISSNLTTEEKPDLYYTPQMTISDFIDVEKMLYENGYYKSTLSNTTTRPIVSPVVELLDKASRNVISQADADQQIESFKQLDTRKDLDNYVYRPAIRQQRYLGLSGGSTLMNYQVTSGYNRSSPNVKGSKADDQFTLRSNIGAKLFKKLEINTDLNITGSTDRSTDLSMPGKYVPYTQLVDGSGNPVAIPNNYCMAYLDTVGGGALLDWQFRPLDEIRLTDRKDQDRLVRLSIGAKYPVLDWLTVELKYNHFQETGNSNVYQSEDTYFTRDLINKYTNLSETSANKKNPIPYGGILLKGMSEVRSSNGRGQVSIHKNFHRKHDFTGFIAGEISETIREGWSNRYYGFNKETGSYSPSIDFLNTYPIFGRITGSSSARIPAASAPSGPDVNRIVSLIANVNYAFLDRYDLYLSARRDGANIFGVNTNNRWKPLWSAGSKWQISKEQFYHVRWLQNLALKASYGYSGNMVNSLSGSPTVLLGLYPSPSSIGQFSTTTFGQIGNAPNPDLRWEEVRNINVGMDFSALQNRFSGSLEVFRKYSKDVISQIPFDPTSGISSYYVNASNLKGTGFELTLNNQNHWGDFLWRNSLNISHAKTRVTKYVNLNSYATKYFIQYGIQPAEGKDAFGISSYRWGGLDPITGDPQGILDGKISKDYNSIFLDSINHQIYNGSSVPIYSGYFQNTLAWKNIELSFNITFRMGYYFRKPTINYSNLFSSWSGNPDFEERWQQPGDELKTNIPSMLYPIPSDVAYRDEFFSGSEVNVLKGDNIRLQDLRLDYRFTSGKIKDVFTSLQVFVYANNLNLIIWRAAKSDYDPDFTFSNGNAYIPTPKTVTVGINIGL